MGGSSQVLRVCNFMTQTQPDPLLIFFFLTQPNPPSLKNQPNPAGRVGLDRVGSMSFLHTSIYW